MKTKIFLFLVFLLCSCADMDSWVQTPSIIVHRYDYQVQPPALAPGAPPNPPDKAPEIVDYRTVYSGLSGSDWRDPTLFIIINESYRARRISIDGQPEFRLTGYQASSDISLPIGEHRIRVVTEIPTQGQGTLELTKFHYVPIRPDNWGAYILSLYD
jgi:hypothetical protein